MRTRRLLLLGGILWGSVGASSAWAQADPILNELAVNPPGTDAPYEYVEIRGQAGGTLTNVYAVAFEGDGANAGMADWVVDLDGAQLGQNGILVMQSSNGHPAAPETTVVPEPQFDVIGLENGSITFMLIRTAADLVENTDYDANNDGTLELPLDAQVLDSVGWRDSDGDSDRVYGFTVLIPPTSTMSAATRLIDVPTPFLATAWFHGRLEGVRNYEIYYDRLFTTSNAPNHASLTPGAPNQMVPRTPALGIGASALLLLSLLTVASMAGVRAYNESRNASS